MGMWLGSEGAQFHSRPYFSAKALALGLRNYLDTLKVLTGGVPTGVDAS